MGVAPSKGPDRDALPSGALRSHLNCLKMFTQQSSSCKISIQKISSIRFYQVSDRNTNNLKIMSSSRFDLVFRIRSFQDKGVSIQNFMISNQDDFLHLLLLRTLRFGDRNVIGHLLRIPRFKWTTARWICNFQNLDALDKCSKHRFYLLKSFLRSCFS